MELLSLIKIRYLLPVRLVLMLLILHPVNVYSQGFGDNLFFFNINSDRFITQHYSYDSFNDKHMFQYNAGSSLLFNPSLISNMERFPNYFNTISTNTGEYLTNSSENLLILGNPLNNEDISFLNFTNELNDNDLEGVASCFPFIGNRRFIINLNDSLFAYLECRDCVSHIHFRNMIRDSTEYYFRGNRVNQEALLVYGNYYERLVPRLVRIHSDRTLEIINDTPEDMASIEGVFSGFPILVKHSDGERWWIVLPRANTNAAAVFLTSHESIHYSHETFFPAIDPKRRDYQYTYRNYHGSENCDVSPNGNFLAFYRYINHAVYNAEVSIYRFDRCTGNLGDMFTEYFIPIQQFSSTKQVIYPLWTNKNMSSTNININNMISNMIVTSQNLNLNYGEDSLHWNTFNENIFFSNSEEQVIFRDPYRNFIRCMLRQNGDFSSSCEVINDLVVSNTILHKALDSVKQVERWNILVQLPNSDLLFTSNIRYKNFQNEEQHSIVKFNSNPHQNPTISSLYHQTLPNNSGLSYMLPYSSPSLTSIHYRMPALEKDCDFTKPDQLQFTLYPNPSPGLFYIQSTDANIYFQSLEVFSMSGFKVYNKVLDPEQAYTEIHGDISHAPAGIYIVVLRDIFGATKFTNKFVKVE